MMELDSKEEVDKILREDFLSIGGEDVHVEAFLPAGEARRRCFQCQQSGYSLS